MVARGRVKNGVVVLEDGVRLTDGTPVIVWPESPLLHPAAEGAEQRLTDEQHRRLLEAIDRIAALPIEGSKEPFSGAEHDKVLYGNP